MPDGRVLFVPFTAPGDRLRARIVSQKRRYARGEVDILLEPGPGRCEPVCAVFGQCGGCTWQHLDYRVQLDTKAAILCDALRRIGKLELGNPPAVMASPQPYHYRSRARVLEDGGRVGYRRRRSHELCAVTRCPVLSESLEGRLASWKPSQTRGTREWELGVSDRGVVRCVPIAGDLVSRRSESAKIELDVEGESIGVSPGVFTQANAFLRGPLVRAVCRAAGAERGDPVESVLELFAGAGFFTLSLARRVRAVRAVESSESALRDLRANLESAGLCNVEVVARRVDAVLPELSGSAPDVVVLDPPRLGLGSVTTAALARLRARRIVYLSCDPATLARDLGDLVSEGYRLVSVEGFDVFPQTPHLEALAVSEID